MESAIRTAHLQYDSYGNRADAHDPASGLSIRNDDDLLPHHRFQGVWWDGDLGLYLHAARWRDPGTGGFLNEDPAGLSFDPPNVYWFARGNPAMYSDPSGLGAFVGSNGGGGAGFGGYGGFSGSGSGGGSASVTGGGGAGSNGGGWDLGGAISRGFSGMLGNIRDGLDGYVGQYNAMSASQRANYDGGVADYTFRQMHGGASESFLHNVVDHYSYHNPVAQARASANMANAYDLRDFANTWESSLLNTWEVLKGAGEGAKGGASIATNTFSFGGSDYLGLTDSNSYQGADYAGSRIAATISREAFITAGTLGIGQLTGVLRHSAHAAQAANQANRARNLTYAGRAVSGLNLGFEAYDIGSSGVAAYGAARDGNYALAGAHAAFAFAGGVSAVRNLDDQVAFMRGTVCFVAGTPVLLGNGEDRTPIDQLRVGDRVATDGGLSNGGSIATDPHATSVDPASWRKLTLRAETAGPDGAVDVWEVQTLRPVAWLEQQGLGSGDTLDLSELLDLREMGVPQGVTGRGPDGREGTLGVHRLV